MSVTNIYQVGELKEEIKRLRDALIRIRDWDFDLDVDGIMEAKRLACDVLEQKGAGDE